MNVGGEGGNSQDFDLNLAPIIDCFTVLITFMLASASFLAIGILDSGVAANNAASNDQKPASIRIDVELTAQKGIVLRVEGKTKLEKKIAPKGDDYDQAAIVAEIVNLTKAYPDTKGLILSGADDVEYLEIIRMMEALRKYTPSILLGGL